MHYVYTKAVLLERKLKCSYLCPCLLLVDHQDSIPLRPYLLIPKLGKVAFFLTLYFDELIFN